MEIATDSPLHRHSSRALPDGSYDLVSLHIGGKHRDTVRFLAATVTAASSHTHATTAPPPAPSLAPSPGRALPLHHLRSCNHRYWRLHQPDPLDVRLATLAHTPLAVTSYLSGHTAVEGSFWSRHKSETVRFIHSALTYHASQRQGGPKMQAANVFSSLPV